MNAAQRRAKRRQLDAGIQIEEVTGSFSYKLMMEHIGGPRFESADFFQAAKAHCRPELAEQAAVQVHAFCKKIVLRRRQEFIDTFQAEFGPKITHAPEPHRAAQANARAYEAHQAAKAAVDIDQIAKPYREASNGPTPTQQAVAAAKLAQPRGTDKLPEHLRPKNPMPEGGTQ